MSESIRSIIELNGDKQEQQHHSKIYDLILMFMNILLFLAFIPLKKLVELNTK